MEKFRTIEIDFDVHKLIETERYSFDERPNDVLRRLLKIPNAATRSVSGQIGRPAGISTRTISGKQWSDEGAVLPHGTLLRMTYSGRDYEGQVVNGKWVINGQSFDSPSGAASGIAITRKGTKTKLDGWNYWYVKRPDDAGWVALSSLRARSNVLTLEDLDL